MNETILALIFIPCSLIASLFIHLSAFEQISSVLQLCLISPWPSMFELFIQGATAYLVRLLVRLWHMVNRASVIGQAVAIQIATRIWNLKRNWARRRASISRFFLKLCHWTKLSQDRPSTPFLASISLALPGVTSALPTSAIPKADDGSSTGFLLVLLFCSLCALGVLVAGHFIAMRTGEMATYGTLMAIESIAWWLIATDAEISILLLFT